MAKHADYKKMTLEEKKRSINLWKKFYESLKSNEYEESWVYWNKRCKYLNELGIEESHSNDLFLKF